MRRSQHLAVMVQTAPDVVHAADEQELIIDHPTRMDIVVCAITFVELVERWVGWPLVLWVPRDELAPQAPALGRS